MTKQVQLRTKKEEFTVDYPEAVEFANMQAALFWPHDEAKVYKDKQDILVNMTESERHGVIETLKLFTEYELIIGNEFWLDFVYKKFPRPADIRPMAAMFAAMELQVHAKFYSTLNEELGLASDEFYQEYKEDPVYLQRVEYLKSCLKGNDDLEAIGSFVFGEGAVLYGAFAYLKHFQSAGKNKLLNVVSGILFSSRDEDIHSRAAAWLFKTLKNEELEAGNIDDEYLLNLESHIYKQARIVYEHEDLIIDKIFEKGPIEGITPLELKNFSKSRINLCLRSMGYQDLFEVKYNPIADTFYEGINGYQFGDNFSAVNNQYARGASKASYDFLNSKEVEVTSFKERAIQRLNKQENV